MLKDVIDRVNQARIKAQNNPHFQHSAKQHAKAIESQEAPSDSLINTNNKSKPKSFSDVYKPYFETDTQH
ncbi:hypothetical protein R3X26_12775 [Vibrio sp. TH_r3]|uniref:hypothetical protein n=1 Tax=Vibrio sp. TH_r3 TaxID=3082084 RepID=UPI00295513E2|nr:hypothetical protein [Vibrio sp. TH_r3]MDV7105277.1 hypothetical protein [Vibrio sp. TH_r3]